MDAYAPEAAVLSLDVLGEGQAILPRIFQQELAELLLRNRRFQIILAPLGVGAVEIGGAFLGVGLEADIRRCLHELGQVVAVRHGCFEVLDGTLADGELIAVRQQTLQNNTKRLNSTFFGNSEYFAFVQKDIEPQHTKSSNSKTKMLQRPLPKGNIAE